MFDRLKEYESMATTYWDTKSSKLTVDQGQNNRLVSAAKQCCVTVQQDLGRKSEDNVDRL